MLQNSTLFQKAVRAELDGTIARLASSKGALYREPPVVHFPSQLLVKNPRTLLYVARNKKRSTP